MSAIGYRYFGFLSLGDGDGLRFTWLQVVQNWGWAFDVHDRGPDSDGNRYGLTLGLLFVWFYLSCNLPLKRNLRHTDGFGDSWGFSWRFGRDFGNSIHLHWYDTTIVHMPWSWEWFRTSHLAADGVTWVHELRRVDYPQGTNPNWQQGWRGGDAFGTFRKIDVWKEAHPYRYVLRSGEVQERIATVKVEEREWRWRWLMGLAWPHKTVRSIDVSFDGEVGERSGSWKGGTIGCGYDLRYDESPQECLRRMERDRKF